MTAEHRLQQTELRPAVKPNRFMEIPTLEKLIQEAGSREVKTLRDRFFQPLIIAQK